MNTYEKPTITSYKLSEETEDFYPYVDFILKGKEKLCVVEENNNLRVY